MRASESIAVKSTRPHAPNRWYIHGDRTMLGLRTPLAGRPDLVKARQIERESREERRFAHGL